MQTKTAMSINERINQPNIKSRFQEVLGKKAAGFVSSVISAVKTNKYLSGCPDSVISAAMIAATLDLPINPNLGFAYIIPYKGEAQFQMGWKGYTQLALRSGQFARMNAAPVYEGQLKHWDAITGDFEYDLEAKTADKIIGYVSYFRLTSGYEHYFYMTVEEIMAHAKKYSQSFKKGNGPWFDTPEAMCLKTVHKLNISKWAPMTQDMELALNFDQATVKNPVKYLEANEEIIAEYSDNGGEETNADQPLDKSKEINPETDMKKGDAADHQGFDNKKPTQKDVFDK